MEGSFGFGAVDGVVEGRDVVEGWCHILRSSASSNCVVCSRLSTRWESVCARSLGGEPGRWAGEQPVLSSTFGTSRFFAGFLYCAIWVPRCGVRVFPVRYVFRVQDFPAYAAHHCCVANAYDGAAGGVGEGACVESWGAAFGGFTA